MDWTSLLGAVAVALATLVVGIVGHWSINNPLNRLVKLAGVLEKLDPLDQEAAELVRRAVRGLSDRVAKKEDPLDENSSSLLAAAFLFVFGFILFLASAKGYELGLEALIANMMMLFGLLLMILGSAGMIRVFYLLVSALVRQCKADRRSRRETQEDDESLSRSEDSVE